jgi:hypothetical protein
MTTTQKNVWEPRAVRAAPYPKPVRASPRSKLGDDVELLHDVARARAAHPGRATVPRTSNPYKLFFLEDPYSAPRTWSTIKNLSSADDDADRHGRAVQQPARVAGLVSRRLIDFIRVHISQVGGLSMARKMAAMCEFFRRPHGLARPRRHLPRRPRRQRPPRPGHSQLRHPGGPRLQPGRARRLPRLASGWTSMRNSPPDSRFRMTRRLICSGGTSAGWTARSPSPRRSRPAARASCRGVVVSFILGAQGTIPCRISPLPLQAFSCSGPAQFPPTASKDGIQVSPCAVCRFPPSTWS